MLRPRLAIAALALTLLAGFHLQPSLASIAPPLPAASHSPPVAAYGPTEATRRAAFTNAVRAAVAQQDANVAAWIANATPPPAPRRPRTVRVSAPVEAPVYESGSIEATICSVFGEHCARAIRVARCESGLNGGAANPSGARGLFEIMLPMHANLFESHGWDWHDSWSDPYRNSVVAYDISAGGTNWSAWVCRG